MTERVPGWPVEFQQRYRAAGYWQGRTFDRILADLADRHRDDVALIGGGPIADAERITYGELLTRSRRVAVGLRELGIGAGDVVLLQLPNRIEFVVTWFGLQHLGAVPVHAQPGHRHRELSQLAATTSAVAYVTTDVHQRFDHRGLARQVADLVGSVRHIIVVGELGEYAADDRFVTYRSVADAPEPAAPLHAGAASDLALLLLSGGTTGTPKLIPRTHDDYFYNSRAAGARCGLTAQTVYLAVLPIAFNFTWNCPGILGTLAVGGRVVLAESPDPAQCFALIERERVTYTAINPQLVPAWLDEYARGTADISSLEVLEIGSARLADPMARRIVTELDVTLQQILGMSEGLFCATYLDDDVETVCTTQGAPVSAADEIRVVDEHGTEVGTGEVGELTVRGAYTPRGYYAAAEHNKTAFTADGFYRTGDQVRRLASGHLIVVGRIKDQINRAGEKIAPAEVEGALAAHPAIESVAMVGEPDPRLGERSVVYLVVRGETVPTRRELAAFLGRAGLAAGKAPDTVRVIETMPLTPLGKIDKKALRAGGPAS
ncbi:(2,3-dihydroxybenzoyl)adenylate synthase [Skermania piniformis]|uniref:AMP-binding protein n=1 Tax=Skermania pinensis TaxID=39122 RepID=A0ABX8S688_9ACTN|nr:AMP-binding protein [Skermania piniformis]QXQ13334.1 AMP-binding protein [Skermania piniformis]